MEQPVLFDAFLILLILLIISPASADITNSSITTPNTTTSITSVPNTITLFVPTGDMIHSTQIKDLISGFNSTGDVLIATSFGLSTYNGSWSTRHMNLNNVSQGLIDDYVSAIEYDNEGNLWIGYSKGLQIYNGKYYRTIADQQLLKSTLILDIQRWNNDMWIATGNSGVHRYRDGTWTWFQPFSPGGPGFHEVDSMALDHASNMTMIATEVEGLWLIRSQDDPVQFESIASRDSTFGRLQHVKRDYSGGVYFFNDSTVVHYTPSDNFTVVLTNRDLAIDQPAINDITSGPDGKLFLATDKGIYIWQAGGVYKFLDRFSGIGTSSVVKTVDRDSSNRVWFSTPDDVGYYLDRSELPATIAIQQVTPTSSPTLNTSNISQYRINQTLPTTTSVTILPSVTPVPTQKVPVGLIDQIIQSLRSFFSGIGMKPRF